jgi:hypothetical protein
MTASFLGLAFAAAINPSLLAVDLVLVVNRRPRLMFGYVLIGGLSMAIAVGLVYLLVVHPDVVPSTGGLGAGAHLALGLVFLILAALLFSGKLHGRQRKPKAAKPQDKISWTQRALGQPRPWLAVLVGVLLGTPGALYLAALHGLARGNPTTAAEVIDVVLFAIIEFALLIIPLALLVFRPEGPAALVRGMQDWLARHGRRVGAYASLTAGAYLTIDAIVNLVG